MKTKSKRTKRPRAKIVQAKIPLDIKGTGAIASGRFAVFTSLLKMGDVMIALETADEERGVPVSGYVEINGKKTFYCLYGFVNDSGVYEPK